MAEAGVLISVWQEVDFGKFQMDRLLPQLEIVVRSSSLY